VWWTLVRPANFQQLETAVSRSIAGAEAGTERPSTFIPRCSRKTVPPSFILPIIPGKFKEKVNLNFAQ